MKYNSILDKLKENRKNYNDVLNQLVEEARCEDCFEITKDNCRYCRLLVIKELQELLDIL